MANIFINLEDHLSNENHERNSTISANSRNHSNNRCALLITFIKWVPVLLISALIIWSESAFIRLCLNFINNNAEKTIYLISQHTFLILVVWSYLRTVFTSIPKVPQEFMLPSDVLTTFLNSKNDNEKKEILEEFAHNLPNVTRTRDQCVRYCQFCTIVKPDRAHHCSVCGYCILKMDHHCPWVNTCICYFNYKYFILFLGYSLIYCAFLMATSFRYFLEQWNVLGRVKSSENIQIILLFMISCILFISLLSLFVYHCYLIMKNRTTLETFRAPIFATGANKNGFNLGPYENFKQVFGGNPKLWFLPVSTM